MIQLKLLMLFLYFTIIGTEFLVSVIEVSMVGGF